MTINHSTITPVPACEVEVGAAVLLEDGERGIVTGVNVEHDDRAGYTRYTLFVESVKYTDLVSFYAEDPAPTVALALDEVVAIIDAHNGHCLSQNPDLCVVCEGLWTAHADANV